MIISKTQNGSALTISLDGRLDTNTSGSLETELQQSLNQNIKLLTFDFARLNYISSAGLRVLLTTQKIMNKQGSMIVENCNADIMDIFEVTGFVDLLTIQ